MVGWLVVGLACTSPLRISESYRKPQQKDISGEKCHSCVMKQHGYESNEHLPSNSTLPPILYQREGKRNQANFAISIATRQRQANNVPRISISPNLILVKQCWIYSQLLLQKLYLLKSASSTFNKTFWTNLTCPGTAGKNSEYERCLRCKTGRGVSVRERVFFAAQSEWEYAWMTFVKITLDGLRGPK